MIYSIFPITGNYTPFIDIAIGALLIAGVIYLCFKSNLSIKVIITTSIFITIFILSAIFELPIVRGISIVAICLCTIYCAVLLTNNEKNSELRYHKKVSKKESSLTANESDELISDITKAITILSSTQTGALITIDIERIYFRRFLRPKPCIRLMPPPPKPPPNPPPKKSPKISPKISLISMPEKSNPPAPPAPSNAA